MTEQKYKAYYNIDQAKAAAKFVVDQNPVDSDVQKVYDQIIEKIREGVEKKLQMLGMAGIRICFSDDGDGVVFAEVLVDPSTGSDYYNHIYGYVL